MSESAEKSNLEDPADTTTLQNVETPFYMPHTSYIETLLRNELFGQRLTDAELEFFASFLSARAYEDSVEESYTITAPSDLILKHIPGRDGDGNPTVQIMFQCIMWEEPIAKGEAKRTLEEAKKSFSIELRELTQGKVLLLS